MSCPVEAMLLAAPEGTRWQAEGCTLITRTADGLEIGEDTGSADLSTLAGQLDYAAEIVCTTLGLRQIEPS